MPLTASASISNGELNVVVGPRGSGKSGLVATALESFRMLNSLFNFSFLPIKQPFGR